MAAPRHQEPAQQLACSSCLGWQPLKEKYTSSFSLIEPLKMKTDVRTASVSRCGARTPGASPRGRRACDRVLGVGSPSGSRRGIHGRPVGPAAGGGRTPLAAVRSRRPIFAARLAAQGRRWPLGATLPPSPSRPSPELIPAMVGGTWRGSSRARRLGRWRRRTGRLFAAANTANEATPAHTRRS